MTGPKVGIVGDADDELVRLRPHDHRLDGDAGDARVGHARRGRAAMISAVAARTACLRGEVEPHAADVGLVDDVPRQDLDDHRRACGEKRPRQPRRPRRRRGRAASAPSGSHRPPSPRPTSSGSSQRRPSRIAASTGARAAATSGAKCSGRLGGVSISASRTFAVAHEMRESAHRIGFGLVERNAGRFERRTRRRRRRRSTPRAPASAAPSLRGTRA